MRRPWGNGFWEIGKWNLGNMILGITENILCPVFTWGQTCHFFEKFVEIGVTWKSQFFLYLCYCVSLWKHCLGEANFLNWNVMSKCGMCVFFEKTRHVVFIQMNFIGYLLYGYRLWNIFVYKFDDSVNLSLWWCDESFWGFVFLQILLNDGIENFKKCKKYCIAVKGFVCKKFIIYFQCCF